MIFGNSLGNKFV